MQWYVVRVCACVMYNRAGRGIAKMRVRAYGVDATRVMTYILYTSCGAMFGVRKAPTGCNFVHSDEIWYGEITDFSQFLL